MVIKGSDSQHVLTEHKPKAAKRLRSMGDMVTAGQNDLNGYQKECVVIIFSTFNGHVIFIRGTSVGEQNH